MNLLSCPKAGKSPLPPYPISVAGLAPLIGVGLMSECSGCDLSPFPALGEIARPWFRDSRGLGLSSQLRADSLATGTFTQRPARLYRAAQSCDFARRGRRLGREPPSPPKFPNSGKRPPGPRTPLRFAARRPGIRLSSKLQPSASHAATLSSPILGIATPISTDPGHRSSSRAILTACRSQIVS